MSDKIFAKGIHVREFGKYGDIKLSINSSELFNDNNQFDLETGWGNFIIKKSRNNKLYAVVDTWKPNQKENIIKFDDISEELPF